MDRPQRFDWDSPHPLRPEQIGFFREKGYVKLKQVVPPEVLNFYGREITEQVRRLNTLDLPMEQRNTYQKAFLQITNIWTKSDVVKEFAFSRRLARLAAELMGCRGVRMYHDQALYKEPGGGFTPWHADQYYWPLATPNTCTVWVPIQATPRAMGPLAFSVGSHKVNMNRDLAISDDSEARISKTLLEQKLPLDETPFDLGEVSYHYGWTFHRAGPNQTTEPRRVMTIIYLDQDMTLAAPKNKNQQIDRDTWCPGVAVGQVCDSPLNPVLYSAG